MKRVITQPSTDTIEVCNLFGNEIACYLSSKSNTPKMLVKLSGGRHCSEFQRWGFVSIAYPTGDVVFQSDCFHASVVSALKGGRAVYTFNNYEEFRQWAIKQHLK
jgi:hypothetical protein